MKTMFWIKGVRGIACLKAVLDSGRKVEALCLQPGAGTSWHAIVTALALEHGIPILPAPDPNAQELLDQVRSYAPQIFILAGYGPILPPQAIAIPSVACVNLHGGKLPEYRGSSPMNWTLINGEKEFGLSIIRVAPGVDTGDVLVERRFPIGPDDTIRELHATANVAFPKMLLECLDQIETGTLQPRVQNESEAGYYPLRFPDDGLLLFDLHTAEAAHNRIRALTEPYPCAFTYYNGRRVLLLASRLHCGRFHGEPGRVYQKKDGALLVCASDCSFWITDARLDDGTPLYDSITRYERLATVAGTVLMQLTS